jgi:mono/diheme cytochrome c family protein
MSPMRSLRRARLALVVLCLLPACDVLPPIDLQRMIYQDRFLVWQRCAYFADGRELQSPPEGTLPQGAPIAGEPLATAVLGDGGPYVEQIPLPVTHALLVRGKARFDVYCAVCHGLRGDGVSEVALNMDLRKPPAIAGQAAAPLPAGRVFEVITEGYGLMRSYAEDLPTPEDRWAVVAYLRALALSQGTRLDDLPTDVRQEAERQLR